MVLKSELGREVLDCKFTEKNPTLKYMKCHYKENSDQFSIYKIEFKEMFFSVARKV